MPRSTDAALTTPTPPSCLLPGPASPEAINWAAPSSKSLPGFSAVCWYFGKALADDPLLDGVPIGLAGTFVGGTFIEQWIRKEQQVH